MLEYLMVVYKAGVRQVLFELSYNANLFKCFHSVKEEVSLLVSLSRPLVALFSLWSKTILDFL